MNAKDKKNAKAAREFRELLVSLKRTIGDDYRAHEESTLPSMEVTIGATVKDGVITGWSYQTGDNSYSGGAYLHPHWAVLTLHRRSNSTELAREAVEEILNLAAE